MKRIAIIAGGDSSEMEVSLGSAQQVYECLDRTKFEPTIIKLSRSGWVDTQGRTVDKNDFSVAGERFDYALIMIHGTPGENGILQGYFELIGMPYSSCSVEVSALTFNKSLCKRMVAHIEGLHLAREIFVNPTDIIDVAKVSQQMGLPMFIKPNASGSSCGVTKVKTEQDILKALQQAFKESDGVLIEEYIEGVEISQGVMIAGGKEYVLPITELVSTNEFFDYQAKYTPGKTNEITPARLPEAVADAVSRVTLAVYKKLGCRGVVRVDYIVKQGKPYFIEVNTVPGMSKNSIVPQQWAQVGLSMGQAFEIIINSTIK